MRTLVLLGLALSLQGAAPAGRYVLTSDTVFDTKTQLTWERNPPTTTSTLALAVVRCQVLALPGTGWRVPGVKELQSLVDVRVFGPALDVPAFPADSIAYVWSSTPSALNAADEWVVDFNNGSTYQIASTGTARSRCVR